MKIKNVQSIICLLIFSLFANQAWAADWIYFDTAAVGDVYYDKSSIKKVSKNIISVWNKDILSEKTKRKYFSILKEIHKAPKNPSMLNYYTKLMEIDCVNRKIKDIFVIFYDVKGEAVYSSPKSESGEWNDILPNTVGEKLIKIVSCEPITPNEAVVAPKVEEPVTLVADAKVKEPDGSNEAVTAAAAPVETAAPVATDKNIAQVNNKQSETKSIPEEDEDVRNFVLKWAASWESGDMKTYRGSYASNFQSKGMNLNEWISYKTNVHQKSKNINIRIDDLQISAEGNSATAVFTQSYSSSTLKDKGKKTLELRKINDKWKIYREIM
jgi:ketosteroid isomerase-like protein